MSLFADVCYRKPQRIYKKTPRIREINKGCRIPSQIKKLIVFLYSTKKELNFKIKSIYSIHNGSKKQKDKKKVKLGINTSKYVQDLYVKNFKTMIN